MNVTLVNPPYVFWRPETQYLERLLGHQPPLGLLSLAAYSRRHEKHSRLSLLDAAAEMLTVAETVARVVKAVPDVVGITLSTIAYSTGKMVAAGIKKHLPDATIIVGGPHISGAGELALRDADMFDVAVYGEGEETFVEVLKAIRTGKAFNQVAGIFYKDAAGVVKRTAPRPPIEKLDVLPYPEWDLLAGFPAHYPPNLFFSPNNPAATLISSRGCPFQCTFCDQSTFGHRYRAVSAQYIYDAVRQLQEEYAIKYLVFCDDTFTLDRNRVFAICEAFMDLKHPLAWTCDANVVTIDREMLRAMKKAGCWAISYGLESGSPLILKSLHKQANPDQACEIIRMTVNEGILAKGLFIMGTPEESEKTVKQTRDFLSLTPLNSMNLSKFTPYPGSVLFDSVADKLDTEYEQLNGMTFVLPSKYLSIEQLEAEYHLTIKHFYKSFRSFRFHVPMLLGSWGNIHRLLGVVPGFISMKLQASKNVDYEGRA